jgi:DNA mismatch endonuclease Vsr
VPEMAVRRLLFRLGLRYRVVLAVTVQDLTVRPDIVFPRRHISREPSTPVGRWRRRPLFAVFDRFPDLRSMGEASVLPLCRGWGSWHYARGAEANCDSSGQLAAWPRARPSRATLEGIQPCT